MTAGSKRNHDSGGLQERLWGVFKGQLLDHGLKLAEFRSSVHALLIVCRQTRRSPLPKRPQLDGALASTSPGCVDKRFRYLGCAWRTALRAGGEAGDRVRRSPPAWRRTVELQKAGPGRHQVGEGRVVHGVELRVVAGAAVVDPVGLGGGGDLLRRPGQPDELGITAAAKSPTTSGVSRSGSIETKTWPTSVPSSARGRRPARSGQVGRADVGAEAVAEVDERRPGDGLRLGDPDAACRRSA